MIEISDSISPDCLTAVGQYRAGRTQNATANNTLAAQQLDSTTARTAEVEQLNLLNAAEAQKMSEMQSQGVLQACLASQMTVTNMQQRNAAATRPEYRRVCSAATLDQRRQCGERKQHLADLSSLIRRRDAESDQHQDTACDPCGAGCHRQRRDLPEPSRLQKAAAILRQQQHDAEERKKEDEAFRKKVEQDKKRHNSAAGNEGKTWKTYIP